jgi:hypothetical protein
LLQEINFNLRKLIDIQVEISEQNKLILEYNRKDVARNINTFQCYETENYEKIYSEENFAILIIN